MKRLSFDQNVPIYLQLVEQIRFQIISGEDGYIDFFVDMLERLRPDLSIERFVGEVPPRFVNETPWGLIRNVEMLRLLDKRLEERCTWQGRLIDSATSEKVCAVTI